MSTEPRQDSLSTKAARRRIRRYYSPAKIADAFLKAKIDARWEIEQLHKIVTCKVAPAASRLRALQLLIKLREVAEGKQPASAAAGTRLYRHDRSQEEIERRLGFDFMEEVAGVDG